MLALTMCTLCIQPVNENGGHYLASYSYGTAESAVKKNDVDIGPAGSTYLGTWYMVHGIGTGNARASRTGPGGRPALNYLDRARNHGNMWCTIVLPIGSCFHVVVKVRSARPTRVGLGTRLRFARFLLTSVLPAPAHDGKPVHKSSESTSVLSDPFLMTGNDGECFSLYPARNSSILRATPH